MSNESFCYRNYISVLIARHHLTMHQFGLVFGYSGDVIEMLVLNKAPMPAALVASLQLFRILNTPARVAFMQMRFKLAGAPSA